MSTNSASASSPSQQAASLAALRIGDRERDRAADCLREHLASGRLDPDEFDQRLESALTARIQADLDVLFNDLPAPRPAAATPAASTTQPAPSAADPAVAATASGACAGPFTARNALAGLVWSAAVAICFLTGWQMWWLLFIPFAVSANLERHRRFAVARRHAAVHAGPFPGQHR
ncbi:MAG TPA: DUF1707 domain-containing protein [Microlunatus sp.]